ncbi:MAG: uracil-DNA glycosylase [Pseudomonadota bacterium]
MTSVSPNIHPSWLNVLQDEFQKNYFRELKSFLLEEKSHHRVFPPGSRIFAAYDNTPFDTVKAVIIGQDPYHGPGQANGLCFSVSPGITPPPSLKNIFKEMHSDISARVPQSGDLSRWTSQGILMLNSVLTVREKSPGSHQNQGWEQFTDKNISVLSAQKENLVFILWGKFAQGKKVLIDSDKHFIVESPHPSPYSASNGFFGSKPFSKTNAFLESRGLAPIDWELE